MTQRWREGRASYRPAGEPIDPRHYGVELVSPALPYPKTPEAGWVEGALW